MIQERGQLGLSMVVMFLLLFICIQSKYNEQSVFKFSVGQNFQTNEHNSMVFSHDSQKIATFSMNNDNDSRTLRIFNYKGVLLQQSSSVDPNSRLIKYSYDSGPITLHNTSTSYSSIYQWTSACTVQKIWSNITLSFDLGSQRRYIDITRKDNHTILAAFKDNVIKQIDMYDKAQLKKYTFNVQQSQIYQIMFFYGENYTNLYVYLYILNHTSIIRSRKIIAYDCETQEEKFSIEQPIYLIGTRDHGQSVFGLNFSPLDKSYGDLMEYSIQNSSRVLVKAADILDNDIDIKSCVDGNVLIMRNFKSNQIFELLVYNISSNKYSDLIQKLEFDRYLFDYEPNYECMKDKLALFDKKGNIWIYQWNKNSEDGQAPIFQMWILIVIGGVGLIILLILLILLVRRYKTNKKSQQLSLLQGKSSRISYVSDKQAPEILIQQQRQKFQIYKTDYNQSFKQNQQVSDQMLARLLKKSLKPQNYKGFSQKQNQNSSKPSHKYQDKISPIKNNHKKLNKNKSLIEIESQKYQKQLKFAELIKKEEVYSFKNKNYQQTILTTYKNDQIIKSLNLINKSQQKNYTQNQKVKLNYKSNEDI